MRKVHMGIVIPTVLIIVTASLSFLSRGRENRRKSECMSNLKKIGFAVVMYSGEREVMPTDLVTLTKTISQKDKAIRGIEHPFLRKDILFCPSGKKKTGETSYIYYYLPEWKFPTSKTQAQSDVLTAEWKDTVVAECKRHKRYTLKLFLDGHVEAQRTGR